MIWFLYLFSLTWKGKYLQVTANSVDLLLLQKNRMIQHFPLSSLVKWIRVRIMYFGGAGEHNLWLICLPFI